MPQFTVIQPTRVLRVNAKSVQHLTKTLKAQGQRWIGFYEDKDLDA